MAQVNFDVSPSGATKVIDGVEEAVYNIVVTGAIALNLVLTTTEVDYKLAQFQAKMRRLRETISEKENPLTGEDASAEKAELISTRRLFLATRFSKQIVNELEA